MKTVEIFIQALASVWEELPEAVGPDWARLRPEVLRLLDAVQRSGSEDERLLHVYDLMELFRPYAAALRLLREAGAALDGGGEAGYRGSKSPAPRLPTLPEIFRGLESLLPELGMSMGLGGLEEATATVEKEAAGEIFQPLRIDAAVPERVVVGEAFVLAASVRQLESALLDEADLTVVHSGEAEAVFDDADSPVHLRLRVSAPDCDCDGEAERRFRLRYGADSRVMRFHLTPRKLGAVSILVQLFQEEEWLGGARLQTEATATTPAGSVAVHVISEPVGGVDPALKRQVEAKEAQLREASVLLAILEKELAGLAPGLEHANVENAVRKQREQIETIEREIDLLMSPESSASA